LDKLAFVLPSLEHGGAQKVFVELVSYLCEQGRDVTLVVLDKQGELIGQIPETAKVHFVNEGVTSHRNIIFWLRAGLKFRRWVCKNDVCSVYSTITGMNLLVLALFLFDRKQNVIVREASSLENVNSFWVKLGIRLLYPRADYIICTSSYLVSQLRDLCGSMRMKVIPNPINIARILKLSAFNSDKAPSVDSIRTIVGVGRLVKAKGFDILIEAFSLLSPNDNWRLLIVGDGPERHELQSQIESLSLCGRVQLLGYQQNPYPIMLNADIYVLSSRWEGYVNTVIEAMTLSKRIVATDCNSEPGNYLRDELDQVLVPVDDAQALATAIEAAILLEVPDYSALLSRHGMAVTSEQYLECVSA
jgi:glycosyltransferase involved in cell wall biosynthesis